MGIFGWSYPPGAANDPNAPYNQDDDGEDRPPEEVEFDTDPYGILEYAIGSGDDFVCFDFDIQGDWIKLHAVLNSETGSFIQDWAAPEYLSLYEPNLIWRAALSLVDEAYEWCYDNRVRISKRGWNQDGYYFVRAVCIAIERHLGVPVPAFTSRQMRYGGKRIAKWTGGF